MKSIQRVDVFFYSNGLQALVKTCSFTLPETNIAPENSILVSFCNGVFSGAMLVLGRVVNLGFIDRF